MSHNSRIEKIDLLLSPKQAVLSHVARLVQFGSVFEYRASTSARLDSVHPLQHLSEQVERCVEETLSEEDDDKIERTLWIALRDVGFLFFLHEYLNDLVASRAGLLAVLSELVDEKLGRMIDLSPRKVTSGSQDEIVLKSRFVGFTETVETLASSLYSLAATVKNIEDKYFNGNSILFSSPRLAVNEIGEQLERSVTVYNNLASRCPWAQPPIDLEKSRTAASKTARATCADLVDMARADALNHLGDRTGARTIARRVAGRLAGTHLQGT